MGASEMGRRLFRMARWQEENSRRKPGTLYHDRYADAEPTDKD